MHGKEQWKNLIFYIFTIKNNDCFRLLWALFSFTKDLKTSGQYSKVGLPTEVSYEEIHCL